MGVGAGKDPLGREASPSSWPIAPLGNSGALRKVRFQMTQAGSLPASPSGGETAFSGEELCSSRLAGIFGWLAPAPSLLAGLPQTTLNKPPLPLAFPQFSRCHASTEQQLNGRRGWLPCLGLSAEMTLPSCSRVLIPWSGFLS